MFEFVIKHLDNKNPHQISKNFFLFKSEHKQGNWTFVVLTVIWGKYNIGFGIPINFPSQRKKNIKIGLETWKLDFCGPDSHLGESTISDLESPSNFQVK